MLAYALRRILGLIPVILLVTLIVFTLNHFIPGDPGRIRFGQYADPEKVAQYNEDRGYNDPFFVQYFRYLKNACMLDFGESDAKKVPVVDIIGGAFKVTLVLAILGIIVASIIGVGAGILSAVRSRTLIDYASMFFAILGVSTPVFWLGILMIIFIGRPVAEALDIPLSGIHGDTLWEQLPSYFLPAMALGLIFSATIARLTRSAMLDVLTQDYIRTAKAKGLSGWTVVMRHALRNASIPITTVIGNSFAYLLVGAVLTETVFALPGLGREIVTAITQRDRLVITGGILFMAVLFVAVNLIVDLLYALFDPRVRLGQE